MTPAKLTRALKGTHAHGCNECGIRYSDRCADPLTNGRCRDCTGALYGRTTWDLDADPIACCADRTRRAYPDERLMFRLGGPMDAQWWICLQCKRTQPYCPTTPLKVSA